METTDRRFIVLESVIFETSGSCATYAQAFREMADYIETAPSMPISSQELPCLTLEQRTQLCRAFDETRADGGRIVGVLSLNSNRVDPETGLATRIDTGGV